MANAIESQDFDLSIGNGDDPLTYTSVEEITGFSGLDGTASEIDTTHLKSLAKEFLMGVQDYGNFNIDTNYLPAAVGQGLLRAAKASRAIQDFQATFADGSVATFKGFVLSAPVTGAVDAKVDGSFSIRISGDVTFS